MHLLPRTSQPTDPKGIIDMEVFSQIRDMDEDEDDEGGAGDHEFSRGIVWGYFEQAEQTFTQMEEAMYVSGAADGRLLTIRLSNEFTRIPLPPFLSDSNPPFPGFILCYHLVLEIPIHWVPPHHRSAAVSTSTLIVANDPNTHGFHVSAPHASRSHCLSLRSTHSIRSHSAEPSLSKLSSLGHFLKGSSAALGIIKVQASCEKMQHYGNLRDEAAGESLTEDEALRRIKALLTDCKRDHEVARAWMTKLYGEPDEEGAGEGEAKS